MLRTITTEEEFFALLELGVPVLGASGSCVSAKGWLGIRDDSLNNLHVLRQLRREFIPSGIYRVEVE